MSSWKSQPLDKNLGAGVYRRGDLRKHRHRYRGTEIGSLTVFMHINRGRSLLHSPGTQVSFEGPCDLELATEGDWEADVLVTDSCPPLVEICLW